MSRTDHPRIPHRKGHNAHRVGHALRSYAEHGKGDLIDWGTPRSRRMALPSVERAEIAEGLADVLADQPRTCWDLGVEYDLECQRIQENLAHALLMEDLADMSTHERHYLSLDGHTNHIRRTA